MLEIWKERMSALDTEGRDEVERWLKECFIRTPSIAPSTNRGETREMAIEMKEIRRGNIEEWLAGTSSFPFLNIC